MEGQSGDQTTVSTSIALLQERFRQLQKTREKREERALSRMLMESEQIMRATSFEPARLSFQNDTIFPCRTSRHQDSLSLGLELYTNPTNFRSMRSPSRPIYVWSNGAAAAAAAVSPSDNSDVDTALRL